MVGITEQLALNRGIMRFNEPLAEKFVARVARRPPGRPIGVTRGPVYLLETRDFGVKFIF